MASFRFYHAPTIHLDSPIGVRVGYLGEAVEWNRLATRSAFEQHISFAIGEQIAFSVITGDLYDGQVKG